MIVIEAITGLLIGAVLALPFIAAFAIVVGLVRWARRH